MGTWFHWAPKYSIPDGAEWISPLPEDPVHMEASITNIRRHTTVRCRVPLLRALELGRSKGLTYCHPDVCKLACCPEGE